MMWGKLFRCKISLKQFITLHIIFQTSPITFWWMNQTWFIIKFLLFSQHFFLLFFFFSQWMEIFMNSFFSSRHTFFFLCRMSQPPTDSDYLFSSSYFWILFSWMVFIFISPLHNFSRPRNFSPNFIPRKSWFVIHSLSFSLSKFILDVNKSK